MRVRNHLSVPFVITNVQKRGAWPGTLNQFMKAKNHSSVPFVITIVQKRGACLSTLNQFMKAKNHSSVPFVVIPFHKRVTWLSTWHQFMKATNLSNVPFAITFIQKWNIWPDILHQFMNKTKRNRKWHQISVCLFNLCILCMLFFSFCADTPKHTKGKKSFIKHTKWGKLFFFVNFHFTWTYKMKQTSFWSGFFSLCLYTQNKRMFLMFFFSNNEGMNEFEQENKGNY